MTTLAVMKQRVADEVARSDLTSMIAYAISDAITYYQSKRFFFNESVDTTFDTVVDQEWYDKYDNAVIPDLMYIDYIKIDISDYPYRLAYRTPSEMDGWATQTGQPTSYTYYSRNIRLYPIPNDVWEVTVVGHVKFDEPASDTEKYNVWMTDAERLIRARSKLNLVRNVNAAGLEPTFSDKSILIYENEERDVFNELKQRTNKLLSTGQVKPYC